MWTPQFCLGTVSEKLHDKSHPCEQTLSMLQQTPLAQLSNEVILTQQNIALFQENDARFQYEQVLFAG